MKFGNINMKETHLAPGGHPIIDPPWGVCKKFFETPNVSDVTLNILNEDKNEIWKHNYERNTCRPWGTPENPPWGVCK